MVKADGGWLMTKSDILLIAVMITSFSAWFCVLICSNLAATRSDLLLRAERKQLLFNVNMLEGVNFTVATFFAM